MLRSLPSGTAARLALCLLALVTASALAACGSSSGGASTSAARTTARTANGGRFDRTKLSACLKQQGVTLPAPPRGSGPNGAPPTGGPATRTLPPGGPPPGGGPRFFGGRNLSAAQRQKLRNAMQRCGAAFRTRGGFGGGAARNPAFRAALAKFVACVRKHGFDLPAPNTSGSGPVFDASKVDRTDPKFVAASRACQALLRGTGSFGGRGTPPGA